jgi:hypothetical protein
VTGFSIIPLARVSPPFDLTVPLVTITVTPTRTGTLTWGTDAGALTWGDGSTGRLTWTPAGGALTWG